MSAREKYVVGFLIRDEEEVLLVKKNRPAWQKGKWNGVGGKVERGEDVAAAMSREFKEEAGARIRTWREFAKLKDTGADISFLVAHGDPKIRTTTDELVRWHPISGLHKLPTVPDVYPLVLLALDTQARFTTIDARRNDLVKKK